MDISVSEKESPSRLRSVSLVEYEGSADICEKESVELFEVVCASFCSAEDCGPVAFPTVSLRFELVADTGWPSIAANWSRISRPQCCKACTIFFHSVDTNGGPLATNLLVSAATERSVSLLRVAVGFGGRLMFDTSGAASLGMWRTQFNFVRQGSP